MDIASPPRTGIYPGTFDPVTKGHLHMIKRASKLVDHLIIAVAGSEKKQPLFNLNERLELLQTDIANMHEKFCTVEIKPFNKLLVHFAEEEGAHCIFRGLRAVSDFEYEFQMTGMNAKLAPDVETVFLMAADRYQFVSSSFIKEICSLGGNISEMVTPHVYEALRHKFGK